MTKSPVIANDRWRFGRVNLQVLFARGKNGKIRAVRCMPSQDAS